MNNIEALLAEIEKLKAENEALKNNVMDSANKNEIGNELLAEYANRIDALFWRFDFVNDKWLFVSENVEKVLGYKPEEWINFQWWVDRIHPEDRDWVPNYCQVESSNDKAHSMEYRMIRKDGSIVWLIDQVGVHNVNGEVLFLYGIMIDITERKEYESKLKEKSNQFDSISTTNPDPLLVTRVSDGLILFANEKCAEMVGLNLSELINNATPNFYVDPNDRFILLNELKNNGSVNGLELKIKDAEGKHFWAMINSKIGLYEGQKAIYTTLRDVTERRNSEEKMRNLTTAVEQSFATIVITDKEGRIEYVNPKFTEITGYSFDEVIGKNPSILKSGMHSDIFYKEMWQVLNAGIHWIGELWNKRKNGELFWELTSISPVKNSKDEITHFISIKEDITERKKVEIEIVKKNNLIEVQYENNLKLTEELQIANHQLKLAKELAEYNEMQHKALIENSVFPITITNFKGKIIYANEAAINIFILDSDNLEKHNAEDFWVDINQRNELVSQINKNGSKLIYEAQFKNTQNDILTLEASAHLITFFGETAVFAIFKDVTEKKKYEQDIIKLDANMRAIIENTLDSIWSINMNYEITYVNDVFKDAFFYNFGVNLYPGVNILKSLPNVISNIWKERYDRAFQGERFIFEDEVPVGESFIYIEVAVNPIVLNGEITGASFFGRDITNKKMAEIELQQQNEHISKQYEEYMQLNEVLRQTNYELEVSKSKSEESDKLKTAILQNISHEIRTPLNGILGFTKLLKSDDLDKEERDEFINLIQLSGKRLIEMVNNVIEISKISTKQINVDKTEFSVNSLLEDLFTTFNPIATDQNLKLTFKGIANFNNSIINSDEAKLSIILGNLISNALKFTNMGSVEFGCLVKDKSHHFYVRDTGVGIAKELHLSIFEAFMQADLSISRNYEGAGLGLAICKGLVDLLGGKIWVESEINKGSTFWFNIAH